MSAKKLKMSWGKESVVPGVIAMFHKILYTIFYYKREQDCESRVYYVVQQ